MTATPMLGGPGPRWRVTQVLDGSGTDASGRFVAGKNVTYQLDSGHTGTVFVPASTFTPEAVKAAVSADAGNLAQISQLTSDT